MNIREWLGLASKLEQPTTHIKHENVNDTDIRSSWEAWDKYWREATLSQPPLSHNWKSYKYTRDISRNVVSKYFASPNDVPSSLADYTNQHMERDIILWAIKNKENESVLEKCKSISYPVLDIVKSVFVENNTLSRDVPHWWCHSNTMDTYYYFDTRCLTKSEKPLCLPSATFTKVSVKHMKKTELEEELLEACMKEIQRMTDDNYALMRREEFNDKWKGLNYG